MSRHARSVRRRLLVPLAALAVAGGGWAAYAGAANGSHSYRTATAVRGDVSATLDLSGTVSASGRADLASSASGKVVSVPVEVGQEVRRGQVIVRLDQSSLTAQVKSARATLAKAQAQLADDEDAQTASVSTTSATTTSTTTTSSTRSTLRSVVDRATPTAAGASSTSALLATIKKDQSAVTTAQTTASTALSTATDALTTEKAACAGSTTASATASPTAGEQASASPASGDGQVTDECQSALDAVESAQAAVATAQSQLRTALDKLTTDLASALAAASPTQPTTGGGQGGAPNGGGSAPQGSQSPSGSGSTGPSVTGATLARDQASIDQARADLVSALAARRAAVVRAPAAGQVRSLSVSRGAEVSAGDDVAIIVGKGLTTVDIEATQTQAAALRLGGAARITPAGSSTPLAGTVSRIAHVPTSTSSSSSAITGSGDTTYAVQVTLTGRGADQPPLGMPVGVAAVIGTAKNVVTVPASAVANGTVEVLEGGHVTRSRVTTGVVGTSTVQVLSGIEAGDEVVLADLDQALPTSGSSTNRFGGTSGGFSGGLGGTSLPGGGPPGFS